MTWGPVGPVARMERSVIRGPAYPGLRFAPSGLRDYGTEQLATAIRHSRQRMCFARPASQRQWLLKSENGLRSHRHASPKSYGASARIQGNVMNSSLCAGCLTGSLSGFGSDGFATTATSNTVAP